MTLQLRSRSLGASHHLQPWCAMVAPHQAAGFDLRSQTTIEPGPSALRLAPSPIPPGLTHHCNTIEFA